MSAIAATPHAAKKPYIGISMEGPLARWYEKTTRKDLAEFERLAKELAAVLPSDARVLEVAPGPGFLSVALAKLGPFQITGLDISESFVRMASEYAQERRRPGPIPPRQRFRHSPRSKLGRLHRLPRGLQEFLRAAAAP